ncbi:MAG TPA: hybrid sensor histidine kinase/response regulator [bacterium]|nr:hybrid sensor histidine kinase/response regulator [bacterium]
MKILIADHEEVFRTNLRAILHRKGYEVTAVVDGVDAKKALAAGGCGLLIVDLKLPMVDGLSLLKHVREHCPSVGVMIVSAIGSLNLAVDALKLGAYDYLLKPFEIEQVGILVEKYFERKKLEAEIDIVRDERQKMLEIVRRLEDIASLKKDIISNVAHELLTPITSIGGYLHLLDEGTMGKLNAAQRKAVRSVQDQFKRLQRLVDNTVALLTRKESIITSSRVDLLQLIHKMIDFVRDDAAKKQVDIEMQCREKYIRADVDVDRIEDVLYHLLNNAIKFNRPKGSVVVHAFKRDNAAVIEVSDTGIGIPESEHERIFDRFYQVHHSITRPYTGTGLGLAIVKLCVELHGGTVSVRSKPNHGTTFAFTIPFNK